MINILIGLIFLLVVEVLSFLFGLIFIKTGLNMFKSIDMNSSFIDVSLYGFLHILVYSVVITFIILLLSSIGEVIRPYILT